MSIDLLIILSIDCHLTEITFTSRGAVISHQSTSWNTDRTQRHPRHIKSFPTWIGTWIGTTHAACHTANARPWTNLPPSILLQKHDSHVCHSFTKHAAVCRSLDRMHALTQDHAAGVVCLSAAAAGQTLEPSRGAATDSVNVLHMAFRKPSCISRTRRCQRQGCHEAEYSDICHAARPLLEDILGVIV